MSARLAHEVAALERTNARLRDALARRATRLPRWAIVVLLVEMGIACGATPLAIRLGGALGRGAAEALDMPLGGPSDGVPGYCVQPAPAQSDP
jgi:hypothetical protein